MLGAAIALAGWRLAAQVNPDGLWASDLNVTLNPTGLAPLSAVARFKTSAPCRVRVSVGGEYEIANEFPGFRTDHVLPILGLYPDRSNDVAVTVTSAQGISQTRQAAILTGPLPDFFPRIVIETADLGLMEPGLTLCDLALTNGSDFEAFPLMFDPLGAVRWYLDLSTYRDFCPPMERLKDGNLVFGVRESIFEYTMLGELARELTVPGYNFHHDLIELPYGFFLAAVDKPGTTIRNSGGVRNSIEDHLIEVNRRTGAIYREWDLRKILDVDRNEFVNATGDWFHMNALWYSERDDCILVSGRTQGVVKINRKNGLVWILAPHRNWGPAGADGTGPDTRPYLLTAVDAAGAAYDPQIQDGLVTPLDFDWPWAQHAVMTLPNGNVFLFDNGAFRNFVPGAYSRAVEYAIDEAAGTVRQVWTYGQNRGAEMFSFIISDVDYLARTGNRLVTSGIIRLPNDPNAKIIELAYPGAEVVFEATLHFKNLRGTGGAGQGQFDILYRSERLPVYSR
jgi:arylsulfate sulfotransferase